MNKNCFIPKEMCMLEDRILKDAMYTYGRFCKFCKNISDVTETTGICEKLSISNTKGKLGFSIAVNQYGSCKYYEEYE